ncbi:MAG: winged helix-turn-helix domain-containing protein [Acidobacteriota bacterium]
MSEESGRGSRQSGPTETRIPDDFKQMVQLARTRAQAEVARKRENVYQAFITEEIRAGKRVPMPKGFWQAVEAEIEPPLPEEEAQVNTAAVEPREEAEPQTAWQVLPQPTIPYLPLTSAALDDWEQRGLSFKDAALLILKREGRPMTAREIVTVAINEGLLTSTGKTPDASLAGQIYTDIHRNKETSLFVIVGPRTYALKSSPAEQAPTPPTEKVLGSVLPGNFPRREPGESIPADSTPDNRKMSYKQVALYLLERERRAMTAKEIVTIALQEGLIESSGKTPDATLAGQLYTEMQRANARFPIKLVGPRTYALTDWYED